MMNKTTRSNKKWLGILDLDQLRGFDDKMAPGGIYVYVQWINTSFALNKTIDQYVQHLFSPTQLRVAVYMHNMLSPCNIFPCNLHHIHHMHHMHHM